MPQLIVNGRNSAFLPTLRTWRDLLADLESETLSGNQVIATVHFDGEEETHFRSDDALARPLAAIQEIRVAVTDKSEMLRAAAQDAQDYMANLGNAIATVAEAFRSKRLDDANAKLQQLLSGIKMLAALLRGIELSLSTSQSPESSAVEAALQKMGPTLEELIKAQTASDWTLVADILEYELAEHTSGFGTVLEELKPELAVR